jgi:hypothetical protein
MILPVKKYTALNNQGLKPTRGVRVRQRAVHYLVPINNQL